MTFDFGPKGGLFYASNAKREEALAALREFISREDGVPNDKTRMPSSPEHGRKWGWIRKMLS